MIRYLAAAAVLSVASPALAQNGAWRVRGDTAALSKAGIGLPTRAGALALTQTGEASEKGRGVDNFAQFQSSDGAIQGTAYIYRAAMPDAALAAYATDRAIRQRVGASIRAEPQASVPLAGQAGRAIRAFYATDQIATGAAFAQAGGWLLKLRVSGPAARRAEVEAALDALLAGVKLDRGAKAIAVRPLTLGAPCPAAAGAEAKPLGEGMDPEALLGLLMGGKGVAERVKAQPITDPAQLPFPASGHQPACVRGTIRFADGAALEFLQPAGVAEPGTILAALNDAGGVLAIQKAQIGGGYSIRRYGIGHVDQLGKIDRAPPMAQIGAWLGQPNTPVLAVRSRTVIDADGTSSMQLPGGLQVRAERKR